MNLIRFTTYFFNTIISIFLVCTLAGCVDKNNKKSYEIDKLIFEDRFDGNLSSWITEVEPDTMVNIEIINEQLVIDTDRGVTLWLNQELKGNLLIRYKRRVIMEEGTNDRLSDMNQFWMAADPRDTNLFTRKGGFEEYDSLLMYYAGIGGNYNTTTRFRKYTGDGNRELISDLTDEKYLLKPNHTYLIEILVRDGTTKLFLDNMEIFHFEDDKLLSKGYFGIRTTWSRQIIDDVEIYRLK